MWRFKKNQEPRQTLEEIDKTLGLDNLVDNQVLTAFPAVADMREGQIALARVSGAAYIVWRDNDTIYSVAGAAV